MTRFAKEPIFWLLFFIILVGIYFFSILPIWNQNMELSKKVEELTREAQSLREKNALFEKEIQALKTDPYYIELLLRKKLHYGQKGEKTVIPTTINGPNPNNN